MAKTIAITDVNGYAAATLLPELNDDPDIDKIIGIDTSPWKSGWKKVAFVRKSICDPGLAEILRNVDVVYHLNMGEYGFKSGSHDGETAVRGTQSLLSACTKGRVGKIISLNSSSVYGLSSSQNLFYSEESPLSDETEKNAFVSTVVDIDAAIEAFTQNHPEVIVTRFRAAPLIGPNIDNWLEQSLSMQVVVLPMGPGHRIQFIHEADLGRALAEAIHNDLPGVYNIAADDTVDLHWCFRHAGARVIPLPDVAVANEPVRLMP